MADSTTTHASGSQRRRPTPRKADVVAQDLMAKVVGGQLPPGSLLPRENELAESYAVNRSVGREAVKLLEVHRLVRPVRRRGTEVLDPMRSLSPEVLRAMLKPGEGHIDRHMLAGLLEVRAGLDVEMSGLAAQRRSEEDLAALEGALARARSQERDPHHAELRRELPVLVARATQNPVYVMLAHWNQVVMGDLMEVFAAARPASDAHLQGIALLVDLIRRREVDAVRSLVRSFHLWATPRVLAAASLASGEPLDTALDGDPLIPPGVFSS